MNAVKLIGLKRTVLLGLAVGINILVLGIYFFVMDPMLEEARTEQSGVDGQISDLRGKITSIKQDIASLKENLPKYEALKADGFFSDQDRFIISRMLDSMRRKTNLSGFNYSVDEIQEVPNQEAANIRLKLMNSRISIQNIVSLFDNDVYIFMQGLPQSFPAHTRIKSFEMNRTADEIREPDLKRIAEGKPVTFVSTNVIFEWMTLAEKPEDTSAAKPASGRPAPGGFRGR
jgi:hypothetical protein